MVNDGSAQTQSVWPIPKFYFQMTWDDAAATFQEVSGLDVESEPLEYRAGDNPVFSKVKMPGLAKTGNVTLKKGVFTRDNVFFNWFTEIKMNTIRRKPVTISLLDEGGKPTIVWKLQNAFPIKITGTDLETDGDEVAVESVEIAHEGLVIENG